MIGDRFYDFWSGVEVQRSLDQAAGSVSLRVGRHVEPSATGPIQPGDRLRVFLGVPGELVIEGFVDGISRTIEAGTNETTIQGSDRMADLAVGSAVVDDVEFRDQALGDIVRELVASYGVPLEIPDPAVDRLVIPLYGLRQGSSAYDAIDRLCRPRGILAYPGREGQLVVARPSPGAAGTAGELVMGRHLTGASLRWDHKDRGSEYIVLPQRSSTADEWGAAVAEVEGRATDGGFPRYRPITILADGGLTQEEAEERARWEAAIREALSTAVTVTTTSWRRGHELPLWDLNQLGHVVVPQWDLYGVMLVQSVRYLHGEGTGTTCELELVRRDAYEPAPEGSQKASGFGDMIRGWDDEEDEKP